MKTIVKIWAVTSLILVMLIGYILLDTFVSLKYEIEEPRAINRRTP